MTVAEVRAIVLEVLDDVQFAVAERPVEITDQTRPIGEIPLFDSILAEDTTITLLQRLGVNEVVETQNPFILEGRPAQVCEVVRAMVDLAGATEA